MLSLSPLIVTVNIYVFPVATERYTETTCREGGDPILSHFNKISISFSVHIVESFCIDFPFVELYGIKLIVFYSL